LQAFLSNIVNINKTSSAPGAVMSGVIQGSIIDPLLFVLYINDLPAVCANCALFADDAKAYKVITNLQDRVVLQSALTALCDWAQRWVFKFSLDLAILMSLSPISSIHVD
jgi:hypothetical protein